jgi:hypothetical protein
MNHDGELVGCYSRAGKEAGLHFFCFTLIDKERCDKWTAATKRKNWVPNELVYATNNLPLVRTSVSEYAAR